MGAGSGPKAQKKPVGPLPGTKRWAVAAAAAAVAVQDGLAEELQQVRSFGNS
jgi:hypothetical protein